jgi:uncharacterized protein (UPF0216 family)
MAKDRRLVLMNGTHKFYREGKELVICANAKDEQQIARLNIALVAEIANVLPNLLREPIPGDVGTGTDKGKVG